MSTVISAISDAYSNLPREKAEAAVAAFLQRVRVTSVIGMNAAVIVADGCEPMFVDRDGSRRVPINLPPYVPGEGEGNDG